MSTTIEHPHEAVTTPPRAAASGATSGPAAGARGAETPAAPPRRLDWVHSLPYLAIQASALLVFVVQFQWHYLAVVAGLYFVMMWGVTAGYHRYFAHRTFETGRVFQFILGWVATMTAQKGLLWWAGHHRNHHRHSDEPNDIHSPIQAGFWWSHTGWIMSRDYDETPYDRIKDFARFPELRWLNRCWFVPPVTLAVALFLIGGLPLLVWGFSVTVTLVWHGTFTINSLSHRFGSRRYKTTDTSRNNFLLALVTLGEGWHNNHHYHQNTANQGWFWWEVDITYYTLKVLSWMGVVRKLRTPPEKVKLSYLKYDDEERALLATGDLVDWKRREVMKSFDPAHTPARSPTEQGEAAATAPSRPAVQPASARGREAPGAARDDARLPAPHATRSPPPGLPIPAES